MAASRGQGTQRVLTKLKATVEGGRYYEAHQMYRTLYFRYLTQKKYAELLDLLYDGATLLLRHDQQSSGADLSILLVDVLNKSEAVPSEDNLSKLARLFSLINPEQVERPTFLHGAMRWSSKGSLDQKAGHPKLHEKVAQTLWKEKNYMQAQFHFLHSTDGDNAAAMLVEYHIEKGYPSEVDLFIAQAVLQYLCLHNKSTATVVFYSYTNKHPSISRKDPPYFLPLLNFLWFLLLAVESGKLAAFTVLCERYQPCLQRDPSYTEYLDRIGQLFFGVPPPEPKPQGMFGNLLESVMGTLGSELDPLEDDRPSTSQAMETEDLD